MVTPAACRLPTGRVDPFTAGRLARSMCLPTAHRSGMPVTSPLRSLGIATRPSIAPWPQMRPASAPRMAMADVASGDGGFGASLRSEWSGPSRSRPVLQRGTAPTPSVRAVPETNSGDDLLSQGASPQVPSALAGLTSVFGMGTGVTLPLWPPETFRPSASPALASHCNFVGGRQVAASAAEGSGVRAGVDRRPCEPSIASTSPKPSAD
jgi:hypothetical protein